MSVTFIEKNKVWKDLLKQFQELKKKPYVAVGFPEGKVDADIIIIASANHFGVAAFKPGDKGAWHIPPRPFMSFALDARKLELNIFREKLMKGILSLKVTPKAALSLLGEKTKNIVYQFVDSDYFKLIAPNAPATIDRKCSTRPLVDHRVMLGALTYAVRDNA